MTFLHREYEAYALFNEHWAQQKLVELKALGEEQDDEYREFLSEAERGRRSADKIKAAVNKMLWSEELGYYTAYNVSHPSVGPAHAVDNRVAIMGFPLWCVACSV